MSLDFFLHWHPSPARVSLTICVAVCRQCCYHDPAPIPDGNKRLRDCFHLMWPNALFRLPRRLHLIPEPVSLQLAWSWPQTLGESGDDVALCVTIVMR